jgi:hypothetical protein
MCLQCVRHLKETGVEQAGVPEKELKGLISFFLQTFLLIKK